MTIATVLRTGLLLALAQLAGLACAQQQQQAQQPEEGQQQGPVQLAQAQPAPQPQAQAAQPQAQQARPAQPAPRSVFIGRLQLAVHTDHVVRLSESTFNANPEGLFFLQALDHNHDTERDRALLTRWQAYYGGPLPFKDTASPWGWVGRLEGVRAEPDVRLADARWGIQLTVNRLPALSQWFRDNRADLFIQVFPLRLNNDYGTWDTFTRFSKRFAPKLVARGYVRTFRMDGRTVAVFENDLIYEVRRDFDVLLRVGKGSRDVPGISERRWMAGLGVRFNF